MRRQGACRAAENSVGGKMMSDKTINEIDSTIESICEFLRERSYPEPEIIRALAILITARARIWKINT